MKPAAAKTGLFVGLNKGHVVTKRELPPRPSAHKGVTIDIVQSARQQKHDQKATRRACFVRRVIREIAGLAPYEKRITALLRICKDKRALKVAKRKPGTHKRAKKKQEEMLNLLRRKRYETLSGTDWW